MASPTDEHSEAELFVSEPITPVAGAFSTELLAQGLAALPGEFSWRGTRYRVLECLEHHKQSQLEGGRPEGERYLRRQEFLVRLDTGQRARLYVQRQSPGGSASAARRRWFIYSISSV